MNTINLDFFKNILDFPIELSDIIIVSMLTHNIAKREDSKDFYQYILQTLETKITEYDEITKCSIDYEHILRSIPLKIIKDFINTNDSIDILIFMSYMGIFTHTTDYMVPNIKEIMEKNTKGTNVLEYCLTRKKITKSDYFILNKWLNDSEIIYEMKKIYKKILIKNIC
jgi:hypothetical protein